MRVLALCAIVTLIAAGPAARAADAYPSVEVLASSTTIVGESLRYPTTGPAKVTALEVTIAPGAETVLHHHPAPMFAYILDGEVTVDYGARGRRVFHKGDGFIEAMEVTHKGINTGSVPVRILAVSMGADGTANVAVEK